MSEALAIHPAHRGWPQLGSMKSHIFHWEVTLKIPGLVNKQFANLKITIEIVDWPSYKIVIFHSFLLVYQRVMTNYEFSKIAIPAMKIMGGVIITASENWTRTRISVHFSLSKTRSIFGLGLRWDPAGPLAIFDFDRPTRCKAYVQEIELYLKSMDFNYPLALTSEVS